MSEGMEKKLSPTEQGVRENGNFRFMARANHFVKDADIAKERERLAETNFRNNTGGLLLVDAAYPLYLERRVQDDG